MGEYFSINYFYLLSHWHLCSSAAKNTRCWVCCFGDRSYSRGQKAEGRRQKAEGRRQKAEGRRQKAEGRRQKARKSGVSTIKNVLITLAVAINEFAFGVDSSLTTPLIVII